MDYKTAAVQADKFIAEAGQFRLGNLLTESPHPHTTELSYVAEKSISDALGLLFDVDKDVLEKYREWIATDAPASISAEVRDALLAGGKIFFTGCGATGRLSILLDAIWRDFWSGVDIPDKWNWENRTFSVMAGGDFALIKSVEGFEDFTQFGAKQIEDTGVDKGDVVFAITEGGETSFVIGTAWQGLKKGARVFFMYNNPDDVLCSDVIRSREVIEDDRITKMNATTGPMAIMGSTRMQATTIELCMMVTIMEMAIRDILARIAPEKAKGLDSASVPQKFMAQFEEAFATLNSQSMCDQLAELVQNEETAYRNGFKSTYFADHLGIDVLTDTTERSPTFCTPAFRKWDDPAASESWTYLVLPYPDSKTAWENMLHRPVRALAWSDEDISKLVPADVAPRQYQIMKQIGYDELMRFRIGVDGLKHRPVMKGDAVVAIATEDKKGSLTAADGFSRTQLESANKAGALTGLVFMGGKSSLTEVGAFLKSWDVPAKSVLLPVPETDFLLNGVGRAAIKMLLNTMSTCIMVRLGRVLGNCMVALVPSNLKLIDRSTRFIMQLTGKDYHDACHLLHETIEYVAPRMQAGQAYPPVVALSVIRVKHNLGPEEAEAMLKNSFPAGAIA
jgi:N-acetylmuramic acid 6-phosphate etherase